MLRSNELPFVTLAEEGEVLTVMSDGDTKSSTAAVDDTEPAEVVPWA